MFTIQIRVRAQLVGEVQLLPDARDGIRVDPLVVARTADVVEVIVDAEPARPVSVRRGRQAANVAPVVVGEEQRDVVGHAHALVVVVLHFLIERPELRRLRRILLRHVGDDLPLVGDDLLEQIDVALAVRRHRHVAVAAHADRDDVLARLSRRSHIRSMPLRQNVAQRRVVERRSPTGPCRSASTPAARASSARGATCPSRCRIRRRASRRANRRRRTRCPTSRARGSCP